MTIPCRIGGQRDRQPVGSAPNREKRQEVFSIGGVWAGTGALGARAAQRARATAGVATASTVAVLRVGVYAANARREEKG